MNLIIFGPPGAGKGTYSSRIAPKLGIVKISTGDIFREAVAQGTELGNKVKQSLDQGQLVPDHIVIEVLNQRINQQDCENGFILDGFPRTINQAQSLDKVTNIDAVLNLNIPDQILVEKLSARRICKECGDIYNIADINKTIDNVHYILPPMPPNKEGICDKCSSELYQRNDDKEEVIKERLNVYKEQSQPVLDFFKEHYKIINIHVTRPPKEMVQRIMNKLKKSGLTST